jgi:anti-sigma regulatory factor (Ser/Thr protein kinase)
MVQRDSFPLRSGIPRGAALGDTVETVQTQFPSTETASRSARAFLRANLETWALDGLGEVTELLTSELVSNVVRHVGSTIVLRAIRDDEQVRVEVDDTSEVVPVICHPRPLDLGGRGMVLVDTLANRWGTELHPGGKTVWFEIDAQRASSEMHSALA